MNRVPPPGGSGPSQPVSKTKGDVPRPVFDAADMASLVCKEKLKEANKENGIGLIKGKEDPWKGHFDGAKVTHKPTDRGHTFAVDLLKKKARREHKTGKIH